MSTLEVKTPNKWVRLHNTPRAISDEWFKEHKDILEREGNVHFLKFPDRKLEYTNDVIKVEGTQFNAEENEMILLISGENCDKVNAVMVCRNDGVDPNDLDQQQCRYFPLYESPTIEAMYSNRPQFQVTQHLTSGVGAIIWRYSGMRREFLLARRSKGPMAYLNRLSNFGGAIDHGELSRHALSREIEEETGLVFHPESFTYVDDNETVGKYNDGNIYHANSRTFSVRFDGNPSDAVNMEPEKARNFGWYSEDFIRENWDDLTQLCCQSFRIFLNA